MENVEITKTFSTRNGVPVTVKGVLELEKELWLDGYADTVSCCEIRVNVEVKGHGDQGSWVKKMTPEQLKSAPAGYTHYVGKLGLTAEQAEIINSVKAELESHPAWIAKQARIAANEKAAEEQRKHDRESGLCPRCGSYCHGDCTSNN